MSFVVTIDGPAAAGKSTTARAVASLLRFLYVDTGALYRALALKVRDSGIAADDLEAVERCARASRLALSGSPNHPTVWLDDVDVSDEIRSPEVSELASRLAAQPAVRSRLVEIQRGLRSKGPLIAEGRDLGTVVFPDAEVKLFLDANVAERAGRRQRELERRGIPVPFEDVRAEIERRDERDRTRVESPLAAPPGALVVDTSGLDITEQVLKVVRVIQAHPAYPGAATEGESRTGGPSETSPR
jgi:cytidylate kinase